MTSLKALGLIYSTVIWIFLIFLFSVLSYRVYRVFIKKTDRTSITEVSGNWYSKSLKLLFGISMLLIAVCIPFYVYIGSAIRPFVPGFLNHSFVIVALLLAGLECYLTFSISDKLISKTSKKVVLSIIVLFMLPSSLLMTFNLSSMFGYPSVEESYIIDLPVKGTWSAGHAGGAEMVNYHQAVNSQKFAMDIVKVNDQGKFFLNEGSEITDYPTLGESIYAPVDGIVINVVDSLPNAGVSFAPSDSVNPAGNHVVIEFEPERYVFLAHMDSGSIRVEMGDSIRSGDIIGQAGNSGNTSWPHLHMHIQDLPEINSEATGYPYRFATLQRKRWFGWKTVSDGFLLRNDLFRDSE